MLFSKAFIPTSRETPSAAECVSHRLLLQGAYLYMVASGMYTYLPLGLRVLNNICAIIRSRMQEKGAVEIMMTALQPMTIWEKTGRDKVLEEVMISFHDRRGRHLCLGPTHEEEVTEIAKHYISSYRQLPLILYQIQTKFRDEARPRYGLVRSCEFMMKDAYSFDKDEAGLAENYDKMLDAYEHIFTECGLNFVKIEADSGAMGGDFSHEFMVPAEIGEDNLFHCKKCGIYYRAQGQCSGCKNSLTPARMIEVGHVFKLGTKYSGIQQAYFLDMRGKRAPVIMGCYGIGVSRILSAVVEQNYDEKGIIWPEKVAPYEVLIAVLDVSSSDLLKEGMQLHDRLKGWGMSVLLDDRKEAAGVKFNDAYLIGAPVIVILGKNYLKTGKIEVEVRRTKEKLTFNRDELWAFLKK